MTMTENAPTNMRHAVVKGMFWSIAQAGGAQIISMAVLLVLTHLLKPSEFGLVAWANVGIMLCVALIDFGFAEAIVQRYTLAERYLDTAFWTALAMGLTLMTVLMCTADSIAQLLSHNSPPEIVSKLAHVIRAMSLLLLFGGLNSVPIAMLRRHLHFKFLAVRTLVGGVVGGVVGVTVAIMGYGVWALVAQQLSGVFTSLILLWTNCEFRPTFKFDKQCLRDLIGFGMPISGARLLTTINERTDDMLIGYFLGPVALGYYSVAYRLNYMLIQRLVGTVSNVAMPAVARVQHEPHRVRSAYYQATRLTCLFSFPCFIGMSLLAPLIVPVVFGSQWMPSIPVMQVLSLIGIVHSMLYFNSAMIVGTGHPRWRFYLMLITSTGNVTGFFIAVHYGIFWVAASYVSVAYLVMPLSFFVTNKCLHLKLADYLKHLSGPIFGTLTMALAISFAMRVHITGVPDGARLAVLIVLGAVVYVAVIFTAFRPLVLELHGMWRTLRNRRVVAS
ncbi:MAG: oligosaccharide flippase family protein [Planctomycetes bacterium]|nr:oligosaccharide flippase family protein [Planctomycetota bacterium]